MNGQKALRLSALVYTAISLVVSGMFFVVATALQYPLTARVGGAVWVLLLSMIVSMPVVTSYFKRRYRSD
jgi:O-antigen/teichoic acid export membrane protein